MKGTSIQLPQFFQEKWCLAFSFFKILLRFLSCAVFKTRVLDIMMKHLYYITVHFVVHQLEVQAKYDHLPSIFSSQSASWSPPPSTSLQFRWAYRNFLGIFLIFGTWNNDTELLKFSSFLGFLVVLVEKTLGCLLAPNKPFKPWRMTPLKG